MSLAGITLQSLFILPITIVAFLALLMVIVFIHEYGHFSVARLLGIRVDVFSIGFGKPLLRWVDRKGTEWRIAMLPLGGYVKFFGDANAISQASEAVGEEKPAPATTQFPKPGQEEDLARMLTPEERKVCFHFKPVWARAAVVSAGPIANFILAIVIFASVFMGFGRQIYEPIVGIVAEDSAAAEAGLEVGDRIISINGRSIATFDQVSDTVLLSGGDELRVTVVRDGTNKELSVTPRRVEAQDRYGNDIEKWLLGVGGDVNAISYKKFGVLDAIGEGIKEVWRILSLTVKFIGQIILGKEDASQLGGPIKMAQYAGQSMLSGFDESAYVETPSFWIMLRSSLIDFIFLAAVVSVSIGFLNLLPVPVLDGGHLLYYAYEVIAGKPLGLRAQAVGFRLGIVLLASLMIFVTWNDISNLIGSLS